MSDFADGVNRDHVSVVLGCRLFRSMSGKLLASGSVRKLESYTGIGAGENAISLI
jgi:hypothetical protein